jgi:small subunit ribosomal protein S2
LSEVEVTELLEAGVHFGHQTKRWNPKMAPYIFGEKKGIHIIDLLKTIVCLKQACEFLREVASRGEDILFVGTKRQAEDVIREEAQRCGMFYVNHRWLGGTLTNFQAVRKSITWLRELERMQESGKFGQLPKREVILLEKEKEKLGRNLSGIRGMERLPSAIFISDPKKERIAVLEARKLAIPIVAIVDTICNPEEIDYPIPSNDDAIKAIRLIVSKIADAVLAGKESKAGGEEPVKKKLAEEEADKKESVKRKLAKKEPAKEEQGKKESRGE